MPSPSLILYGGRIYPDANPRTHFEAMAIWKDRVTDLGNDSEILSLRNRETKTTNLHGKVVLPGFSDSHIHLLNYGTLLRTLDLTRTRSIEELKRQVAQTGSHKDKDEWILGRGWDDERLREHRYPTKDDLDKATTNPVFLKRVCGHVAIANSKALSLAGISSQSRDPEGGIIARDPHGEPTGVLREYAIQLVERVVPQSFEENRKAIILAARRLGRQGITSLHCIVGDVNELVALRRVKQDAEIPQSIYAVIPLHLMDQLSSLGMTTERNGGDFRIGGVKVFLDGSLGARTAALKSPYSDDVSNRGMLTIDKDELQAIAKKARETRFQLCIHAIGDRAVRLAVQVLGETFGSRGCKELRHRIEHVSLVDRESISKMGKLGIIASVQPRFIYSDSWAGKRVGSERILRLYPFSSFIRNRVLLTAGSDCPVEDPSPFEGVWSAAQRPGLDAKERLTVTQAMEAYTANASYASFSEDTRGTLFPGMIADLVVVDRDPFDCDLPALRKTRVLHTIIGGRVFS